MRHLALAIGIFIVILVALSFGEKLGTELFSWMYSLAEMVFYRFHDISQTVQSYLHANWAKVLIALLLTIPISYWIRRQNKDESTALAPRSKRKLAVVLAFFLGWLGVHRFYLGQIFWGFGYLLLFYLFTPLAVLISWIDALRYLLMSDDEFTRLQVK